MKLTEEEIAQVDKIASAAAKDFIDRIHQFERDWPEFKVCVSSMGLAPSGSKSSWVKYLTRNFHVSDWEHPNETGVFLENITNYNTPWTACSESFQESLRQLIKSTLLIE